MTPTQEIYQCDGPGRPTVAQLTQMLATLPQDVEVRAISIKGQGGFVYVELYHPGPAYQALDTMTEFIVPPVGEPYAP